MFPLRTQEIPQTGRETPYSINWWSGVYVSCSSNLPFRQQRDHVIRLMKIAWAKQPWNFLPLSMNQCVLQCISWPEIWCKSYAGPMLPSWVSCLYGNWILSSSLLGGKDLTRSPGSPLSPLTLFHLNDRQQMRWGSLCRDLQRGGVSGLPLGSPHQNVWGLWKSCSRGRLIKVGFIYLLSKSFHIRLACCSLSSWAGERGWQITPLLT